MDQGKRDFKRSEHEAEWEREQEYTKQLQARDQGPWYLRIDGKILKSQGQPKVFDLKKGANNYALAIIKNKPELQGKIMLTKSDADQASTEAASGGSSSAGNVASSSGRIGPDTIVVQEHKKGVKAMKYTAKTRSPVAKAHQAIGSGSGEHKDKKKVATQVRGQKHKSKSTEIAEGFNGEYDDEAGMAQSNLRTMARAVDGLLKTIKNNDNLPEWGQEKIAKAEMMLVSVWDYLLSQKEMGMDPKQDMAEGTDNQEIGQQMANDGVTYSPEKENEIINLMSQYMQKAGMGSKQIRYLLSYDEDYISDQLSFLPKQGVAEGPEFDKWADERAASQLHKLKPGMVQDRKTGKWYDPNKEFDKKMNSPEVMAQMKRMATKEGVAEDTDKEGYHTRVQRGDFRPSKYGEDEYNYLHDLMNTSGDSSGPQLVTINDKKIARQIATMYGADVEETGMGTYRIVQRRGDSPMGNKRPKLTGVAESNWYELRLARLLESDLKK
jgi:hypothetical protein